MRLSALYAILSVLAIVNAIPSQGQQFVDNLLYPDTLLAGDTTTILCNVGYIADHDKLRTFLFLSTYDENCTNYGDSIHHIYSEQYDDTIIAVKFYIPPETCPSKYALVIFDQTHPDFDFSFDSMTIVTSPMVIQSPADQLICQGDPAILASGFSFCKSCQYQWFKNNDSIPGANQPDLTILDFSFSDTGSYFCTGSNEWGSDTTQPAKIDIVALPDTPACPEGIMAICQGTVSTDYHIPAIQDVTTYNWSISPPDAGILEYTDTTATVTWDEDFTGQAGLLVKVRNGECRGPNSDTLIISILGPHAAPEICIVGVDPGSGKNMVVWEKSHGTEEFSYIIHRETNQANLYLPLDTIETGELTVFIDSTSTPELVSQRYKLSLIDTCGFVSDLSTAHKTIHLTNNMAANGNVNLIWDGYEGFAFLSYTLYHGSHEDSMEYINTVPSNVFIYSNIVPFPGDNYFQIEAIRPEGCTPSLKSVDYGSSQSNILYVETGTGTDENTVRQVNIFPVPARDYVNILIPGYSKPVSAKLANVSGQILREFIIDSGSFDLDITSLPGGAYFLLINQGDKAARGKIFKFR